jgi:hypothetical protein
MGKSRDTGFTLPGRTLTTHAHLVVVLDRLPASDHETLVEALVEQILGAGGPRVSHNAIREALLSLGEQWGYTEGLSS